MKIDEFQAKQLLDSAGVAVPAGVVARKPEPLAGHQSGAMVGVA